MAIVDPTEREERRANACLQPQEEVLLDAKHQLLELPHPSELRVSPQGECFTGAFTVSYALETQGSGFGFVKLFGITVNYSVLGGWRPFCLGSPCAEMFMRKGGKLGATGQLLPLPMGQEEPIAASEGWGGEGRNVPKRVLLS